MENMNNKNKKILLLNPCGWQKESINLGLSYLATPLIKEGFEVLILDLNRYELDDAAMLKRVCVYAPFMIGISLKTATASEGGRLARLLAETLMDVPIVGGGPHMTLCADDYMTDNPVFSYGVMGEGEESCSALAMAVYEGRSVSDIPAVIWRNGKNVVINEWTPPQNLDALPFPNLNIIEGFSWQDFRYPILTSRGCPFSCIYCCVNKLTGSKKWRSRSPQSVVEEIEFLVRTKKIYFFEIWDDNFTLDIKRAKEICRELIARRLSLSWWCHNGIRADRIDLELAKLMKKAGCTSIAFGMETGDPKTFASIKKGEPLSAVVNAVKIAKKAGIQVVGYFIIGLPGDNLETFIETVHFQRKLKLDHYTYGMLIPYPKTELWDIVHEQGELLCHITETQHFSDDLVPVSFELPAFPKQDMVRAFYITRYMDLFEATDRLEKKQHHVHVVYLGADHYLDHIAGMIITCPERTRHTVVCSLSSEKLSRQRGFVQVSEGTELTTDPESPTDIPQKDTVYVCVGRVLTKRFLLSNANIIILNLRLPTHYTVQVRRYVPGGPLPQVLLAIIGTTLAASDIISYFGPKKIWNVFRNQFVSPYLTKLRLKRARIWARIRSATLNLFSKPLGLLVQTSGKTRIFLISLSRIFTTAASLSHFTLTKGKLRGMRHKKSEFPYDEYTSYM